MKTRTIAVLLPLALTCAGVVAISVGACSTGDSNDGEDNQRATGGATAGAGSAITGAGGGGNPSAGGTGTPGGGGTSAPGAGGTGSPGAGGTGTPGAGGQGLPGAGGADPGAGGASPVGCRAPVPGQNPGNACKNTPPPALRLTEVQRGFTKPVFLTHAPGDTERLFVVELAGRVRVIRNGAIEATPFMDITSIVKSDSLVGEQGLLGLAFHPRFAETGRIWVSYTARSGNGDNVVAEYRVGPNGTVDNASARILVNEVHPSYLGNHNGGMLAFGPDGCLYTSLGDGGDGNDPGDRGQNTQEPLGSVLRIDVDTFPAPAVGNMTGPGVDPRTWAYGLRNPWRFSFDRVAGDLYIGDVGQGAWEEIDVEPAGTGHMNYGWKVMEGKHCRGDAPSCDTSGKRLPAAEKQYGTNKAVIGGYVYRGPAIPGMVGRYVYGDHISRRLWSFTYSGETGGQPTICDEVDLPLTPAGDISSFGEDAAGELYVLTLNGIVYRIEPG